MGKLGKLSAPSVGKSLGDGVITHIVLYNLHDDITAKKYWIAKLNTKFLEY